ncbi:hypothetical protein [Clostridium thailandense]
MIFTITSYNYTDDWETRKLNESIEYIQSTMKEAKTGPEFLNK